jgi:hypothetical protein
MQQGHSGQSNADQHDVAANFANLRQWRVDIAAPLTIDQLVGQGSESSDRVQRVCSAHSSGSVYDRSRDRAQPRFDLIRRRRVDAIDAAQLLSG